tara:strand:- start:1317 stop:2654 length:1338 start_codon:yes stop_codon:yes gene_type:complete
MSGTQECFEAQPQAQTNNNWRKIMTTNNHAIKTPFGKVYLFYREKQLYWNITFEDKKIPENKRRLRRSLSGVSKDNIEIHILRVVEEEYNQRIKNIPNKHKTPLSFIKHYYFPYLDKQAKAGAPKDTKGNWSEYGVYLDKKTIKKHLIPFIKREKLGWSDFNLKTMTKFVVYLRGKNITDRTIQAYKGNINHLFREAIKEELIEDLPTYPRLKSIKKKHGLRLNSYARATRDMVIDLQKEANTQRYETFRGLNKKKVWNRHLLYFWIEILIDTGIRPFSKKPFRFVDIQDNNGGLMFWRDEKGKEYRAEGGERMRKALKGLKTLYFKEGLTQPEYVLSNPDGTQATSIDVYLRNLLEKIGWKDKRDLDGRRYVAYSIRKWHINYHLNEAEENIHNLAERVGHSVQTLLEYYLDRSNMKHTNKGTIDCLQEKIYLKELTGKMKKTI